MKMIRSLFETGLVLGLIACGSSARAQHPVFENAPEVSRLPNGLTVVSVRTDAPGIIAYYTLVRVGARDEVEEGHSGFAHLFEHMMFRGTERYPQSRYEETIQSFGADNNAYTTQDFTLYTVTAPSSALASVIDLEADRFQSLSYDESVFRTETGAVRGEYDTQSSNPFLTMWETLSEMSFSRHTYGHTTLGYLRDIERMPEEYEYSRRFFSRFYTPDNTTIIVAGDVDHAALVTELRGRYGAWRGRRHRARIPTEPEPTAGATRHIDWPADATPRMMVGWRTPAFVNGATRAARARSLRTSVALRVVHGLAFSEPSPLYQRLVVRERRLLELGSWADDFARDPHLFIASAKLAPASGPVGPALQEAVAALQTELDRIGRGEASAERIDAVKSNVRYAMLAELTTPTAVADLAARFIAVGGTLDVLEEYVAALAALRPEDIAEAAREYLNANRRFVVTLAHGPVGSASEEASP